MRERAEVEEDELLQREVDGENSLSDSARVLSMLEIRPDLAARLIALRRAVETLERAERLDPPPGFSDSVMSAIARPVPARGRKPGWRDALATIREFLSPHPVLAYACVLIFGVGLGSLVSQETRPFSRSETEALSGTALTGERLKASKGSETRFEREGVRGGVSTTLAGERLTLSLRLESTRPLDVRLEMTGLSPRGFSSDGRPSGDVVLGGREIRFSYAAGSRSCGASFGLEARSGVSLRLYLSGDPVPIPIPIPDRR